MLDSLQNRNYLAQRHRLSHQQIDRFLGEDRSHEFLPEKIKRLEAVKHFIEVTDLLRNNAIFFVCIKGPLLSYRMYQDPSVRLSHDIDLLIREEDIEPVVKILIYNGFDFNENIFWPQQKIQQQLLTRSEQHLSFHHKSLKYIVEIHWVLMHTLPVSITKQREIISGNLTEIEFTGRSFTVLSKEFELLYLLIHGSRHMWMRLKWLLDINEYPIKEIDTERFIQLASQFKAGRIIGQTNVLLKKYFDSELPFPGGTHIPRFFIQQAQRSFDNKVEIEKSTREMIILLKYSWYMFPGVSYKLKIILSSLFRPRDLAEIHSPYKLMYYLYRPYSFFKRRILHAG